MRPIKLFAFLLGLLIAAPLALPARATILFAGGEDVDFTFTGSGILVNDTTGGRFRAGWARLSIALSNNSATDPPARYFDTPIFANQSTVWVHAETYTNSTSNISGSAALTLIGSDGVRRLMIRGTGTAGTVKISTRNTAGTFVDLVTCSAGWPVGSATLSKLDWFTNYAVSGHTTLYLNGSQICDYAGDVTTNSVTAVKQLEIADLVGGGIGTNWSELMVSTTDTRGQGVFTCYPAANGVNMAWNGAYTNVNPTAINDASAINTGSNTQSALFTCPALPAGTYSVPAVTQSARVVAGSTGPQNFYWMARPATGSTDYNNGSTQGATTAFTNYQNVWQNNPATSSAWTTADVTTGVNFGIQSQP